MVVGLAKYQEEENRSQAGGIPSPEVQSGIHRSLRLLQEVAPIKVVEVDHGLIRGLPGGGESELYDH